MIQSNMYLHHHRHVFAYELQVHDVIPVRAVTQQTGSDPKWRVCETRHFRFIQKPLLSVTLMKRRQTRRIEYSNSHSCSVSTLIHLSTKCRKWAQQREGAENESRHLNTEGILGAQRNNS